MTATYRHANLRSGNESFLLGSDEGLTVVGVLDGDVPVEDWAEFEVVPVDGGETDDD